MIPRIIHQTWKSETLPEAVRPFADSWQRLNPGWERVLWTDAMLLDFVLEHYPQNFELYCSYTNPVSRADAARYMLLRTFGGVYADIDVECLGDLSSLDGDRVVLCHEPPSHWAAHAPLRNHPLILFNGVMASPAGHPFWDHVISRLPLTRHSTNVLDLAGPCMLTAAYLSYDDRPSVAVHPCHLFTPTTNTGATEPEYGEMSLVPLTRHEWQGSWYKGSQPRVKPSYYLRKLRNQITRGRLPDPVEVQSKIDREAIAAPLPDGGRVAILVPVRDMMPHLDAFMKAVSALDLPPESLKLVFCEGDSKDRTAEKLAEIAKAYAARFREVRLLTRDLGNAVTRQNRSKPKLQRNRRGGLAVVRNHLIEHGIDEADDWALWIDADVWKFPTDIFQILRRANARIVAPNCVIYPGGPTFDLNTFITNGAYAPHFYERHLKGGIFQPPFGHLGRLFLDGLRHTDRVELDGVGGTMLLVDARLHRGGLRFPELPYKDLIETEAFGVLARDIGVRAVGLPNVEILHSP